MHHEYARGDVCLMEFLTTDMVQMLFLLFFWVPFAVLGYVMDVWDPDHSRQTMQKLVHPIRHMRHIRELRHEIRAS
jgi:hypothetical protein